MNRQTSESFFPVPETTFIALTHYLSFYILIVVPLYLGSLDIPSKEMLEEAIKAFEGAVIAVSHDRYFLKQIATRVLLVREADNKFMDGYGRMKKLVCNVPLLFPPALSRLRISS